MKHTGFSICNKCGSKWPSAPVGVLHKCTCSGGMCAYEYSESGDEVDSLLALADRYAASGDWHGAYCAMTLIYFELRERL